MSIYFDNQEQKHWMILLKSYQISYYYSIEILCYKINEEFNDDAIRRARYPY